MKVENQSETPNAGEPQWEWESRTLQNGREQFSNGRYIANEFIVQIGGTDRHFRELFSYEDSEIKFSFAARRSVKQDFEDDRTEDRDSGGYRVTDLWCIDGNALTRIPSISEYVKLRTKVNIKSALATLVNRSWGWKTQPGFVVFEKNAG